jgi:hypothetical protein
LTAEELVELAPLVAAHIDPDRWRTKPELAAYFGCKSPRWIELRMAEGAPTKMIAGKRKGRVSEWEPWLEAHGHIRAGGGQDPRRHLTDEGSVRG